MLVLLLFVTKHTHCVEQSKNYRLSICHLMCSIATESEDIKDRRN